MIICRVKNMEINEVKAMGERYVKEYSVCCPRTLQKGKHQVEYAKATCTRVPDTLLHFHCTINGKCKDCERDYQE